MRNVDPANRRTVDRRREMRAFELTSMERRDTMNTLRVVPTKRGFVVSRELNIGVHAIGMTDENALRIADYPQQVASLQSEARSFVMRWLA